MIVALVPAAAACSPTSVAGTGRLDPAASSRPPALDPTCPSRTMPVRQHDDLAAAVLQDSPQGLPSAPADSGPETLESIVQDYGSSRAEMERELTAAGFVAGYVRVWAAGRKGTAGQDDRRYELVVLHRFGSPDGACRFLKWKTGWVDLKPVPAAVPGTVALETPDDGETRTVRIYATKGPFLVEIATGTFQGDAVDVWAAELQRRQHAQL